MVGGGREAGGPAVLAGSRDCEVCEEERGKFLAAATPQSSGLDHQLDPAGNRSRLLSPLSRPSLILWLLIDMNFLELNTFEMSWLTGSC